MSKIWIECLSSEGMVKIMIKIQLLLLLSIVLMGCQSNDNSWILKKGDEGDLFPFNRYDEVESYSFNPGADIELSVDLLKGADANYEHNIQIIALDSLQQRYYGEATESTSIEHSIVDKNGKLALSAQLRSYMSDDKIEELRSIFSEEKFPLYGTLCIPIFRDAIVFRDSGKIVGWIDFCFECQRYKSEPSGMISIDGTQWKQLKELFSQSDHEFYNN